MALIWYVFMSYIAAATFINSFPYSILNHLRVLQERLPLEEVFEQLRTSARGLSSDDAEARLHIFGYNKLEEKTVRTSVLIYAF